MSLKHRIKVALRESWSRALFHSGAWRVVDRIMPRRLTILAGHCVSAPSNTRLPKDMKIAPEKLEHLLATLGSRFELARMDVAWRRMSEPGAKSVVALTMDDGYRDNRTHLVPLLARVRAGATVYLETDALERRTVNWSHRFFWVLEKLAPLEFVERYAARAADARTKELLRELVSSGRATSYHLKRVLKYDAPAAERTRVVGELFSELGGDERALCDELYMTWDDARALDAAGVELGGHTVHHEILSRLDDAGKRAEIGGCRATLEQRLGARSASFAYPFGRRWDYDAGAKQAAKEAGFATATTTHAGTNSKSSDAYELKRLMIDEDVKLHVVVTEACGGFDLLRRIGLDLSE